MCMGNAECKALKVRSKHWHDKLMDLVSSEWAQMQKAYIYVWCWGLVNYRAMFFTASTAPLTLAVSCKGIPHYLTLFGNLIHTLPCVCVCMCALLWTTLCLCVCACMHVCVNVCMHVYYVHNWKPLATDLFHKDIKFYCINYFSFLL